MRAGLPLDDEDRRGWLGAITRRIARWRHDGICGVIACSALKRAYRDQLRVGDPDLVFAYLEADEALLLKRVAQRSGHFMPPQLIASQLQTLQPPSSDEKAVVLDAREAVDNLIEQILDFINLTE